MSVSLSSIFSQVAHKQLVAVDLPHAGSHQHELNGVTALKDFFGTHESKKAPIRWYYFADDVDPINESGSFKFYDARKKSTDRTGRSEWRFYYTGSFLEHAGVNDWLVLVRTQQGEFLALVFQNASAWMRAGKALFAIPESQSEFKSLSEDSLNSNEIRLLQSQILGELGLEVSVPTRPNDEDLMLKKFGRTFPQTKEMSEFARLNVEVDPNDPDRTLVQWLEREEQLFRALEGVIILERLKHGITSVDEFVKYSLSVQNRRKSRMGFALQNQLSEIFSYHKLKFNAQAHTEGNNKPDFLFPGEKEYHDPRFSAAKLVMLGAKSTAKDRWRQVLVEADRIPSKHLCTLEPGISTKQTEEMTRQNLTLVLPSPLLETYTDNQRKALLSLQEFIDFVKKKQP
ncbi:MAG: type II restriction endonuclease [Bacteroidota bacterium]